jgi:hypothetical protein
MPYSSRHRNAFLIAKSQKKKKYTVKYYDVILTLTNLAEKNIVKINAQYSTIQLPFVDGIWVLFLPHFVLSVPTILHVADN